jgi:hypothetical protein
MNTTTETITIPLSYHTPGPWGVRKHEQGFVVYYTDGEIRSNTAQCYDNTVAEEHGTAEANARLIAAAPRMLDALHSALDAIGDTFEARDNDSQGEMIRDIIAGAIAAATGKEVQG